MKYIDAEKLKAEIERQQRKLTLLSNAKQVDIRRDAALQNGVYTYILDTIDSLQQEQPEVDLEKEINRLDDTYFDLGGIAVIGATYYLTVEDLKDIARHFYELGLNARKEENK